MQINATLLSLYSSGSSTSAADALVSLAQGRAGAAASVARLDPVAVLKDAEKNGAKQITAKANEAQIRREIEDFTKGLAKAKTVDDLLNDPKAMKVLLTANGLEEYAGYKGLVAKALKSDPKDASSLAVKLAGSNAAWLSAAKTYQFATKGLTVLKDAATVKAITNGYVEVRWREGLDASAPGVSAALTFKDIAKTLTSPYRILGSGVAREVVTTALGLPPQIAYQPLSSQATAITSRLDLKKLQDPAFVEAFVHRFLINLNSSASGVTA